MTKLSKRQRFVITSISLATGFLLIGNLDNDWKFLGIAALSALTALLFFWSLKEGIGLNATALTLILPAFFTLGVGLFWFLLPSTVFTRLPILILFGVGIYVLCLTMNIFSVSAVRTIALARAAKGVGFVLTLFTAFLLFDAILSVRASIFLSLILVALVSFPLFLQGLWVSRLKLQIEKKLLVYSAISTLSLSIIYVLLFFWPVSVIEGSIFLTVGVYMLLGLGQVQLEGRLFKQTVREYLLVGSFVFLILLLLTSWRV